MKGKIIAVVAIVLLAVTAAWAADADGKWTAKVPGAQGGAESEITFVFKVAEGKLTGTLNNTVMAGEVEIKEGKITGDEISFTLMRNIGGADTKVLWKGKIAGDEIKFTRSSQAAAGGAAPAGGAAAGGAAPAGGAPTEIVAKRVKP